MLTVLTLATILALPARMIVVLMRGLDMSVVEAPDEQPRYDHVAPVDRAGARGRVLVTAQP